MPEKVAVELEARIAELVGQHRSELAQLVEQRLAARNGATHEPAQAPTAPSEPAIRVCEGCGEAKPEAAFEKYRRRCRECRRRDRRIAAPTPAEPGRPAAIDPDELRERARVDGPAADDLTTWLVSEGYAEQTPAGLVPTGRGVELGAGIS